MFNVQWFNVVNASEKNGLSEISGQPIFSKFAYGSMPAATRILPVSIHKPAIRLSTRT